MLHIIILLFYVDLFYIFRKFIVRLFLRVVLILRFINIVKNFPGTLRLKMKFVKRPTSVNVFPFFNYDVKFKLYFYFFNCFRLAKTCK